MYLILILIAIVAIIYKSYLHEKLEDETHANVYAKTGFVTFKHFFPLKKKKYTPEKYYTVRKASIALAVFWIAFGLTISIGLVEVLLDSA
jgi:hypothetical protein